MCDKMWILYNNQWQPAQWLDLSSIALLKAKFAPKKGHGHSHCLMVCCPSDPLQLSESWWTLHVRNMLSKLMRCTETTMQAASTHQQKGPNSPWQCPTTHSTTSVSKLKELGYKVLPHLPYSPNFSPPDYHFFKHLDFLQGKCFHSQQEAEHASQVFIESQTMDFNTTGINKLISHWKKWFLFWLVKM